MRSKKITSILVAAAMLTAAVPVGDYSGILNEFTITTANAASIVKTGKCGASLDWTLSSDGLLIISGEGAMYDYYYYDDAPWHNYYENITQISFSEGVTHIGDNSFFYCNSVWKVNLPTSLKSIGTSAFEGCHKLESISIPDNVEIIDSQAFKSCYKLKQISLPKSLKVISYECFYNTAIEKIDIPEGVTSIESGAFYNCTNLKELILPDSLEEIGREVINHSAITEITIPSNVSTIENYAFTESNPNALSYENVTLVNINVDKNNKNYSSEDGVLYNKDKTQLLVIPEGKIGDYIVPASVKSYADGVFSNCINLSSITLNKNFTEIQPSMFEYCKNLQSIDIPNDVKNIGNEAFYECQNLTEIRLPESIESIGEWAFCGCVKLETINLPDSLTIIDSYAFYRCESLKITRIPQNVTQIGGCYAFSDCESIPEIDIPISVTSIGKGEFQNCYSLKSITINNPECEISDGENTIYEKAIIYGHKGSTAEEYAKKYNREFRVIGEKPVVTTTVPTTTTKSTSTTTKSVSTATTTKKTTTATTTKKTTTPTTTKKTTTTATTTTSVTTTTPATLKPTLLGDANCDGVVSIADAAAIFQCLANPDKYFLSAQGKKNADVDGKLGITPSDAIDIQRFDAKLIESFDEIEI